MDCILNIQHVSSFDYFSMCAWLLHAMLINVVPDVVHTVTGGKLSKVSGTCGPNYEKISNTLEKSTVLPCQKTLTGNMPQMGKNITSLLGLDLIET